MCGRFVLEHPPETLKDTFRLVTVPDLRPRYNIAPTQEVAIIRKHLLNQQNELVLLKWGLIPSWAKDPTIGSKLINARSETVSEKPSFKHAFRYRRCVIPASGFYEWERKEGQKVPHYFYCKQNKLMNLAGLWDSWTSPEGSCLESCVILTTESNSIIEPFHHRMPVILDDKAVERWLKYDSFNKAVLLRLLRPFPKEHMVEHEVSQIVNSPKIDNPECVLPI